MGGSQEGPHVTCSWQTLDPPKVQIWPPQVPTFDTRDTLILPVSEVVHVIEATGSCDTANISGTINLGSITNVSESTDCNRSSKAAERDSVALVYEDDTEDITVLEIAISFGKNTVHAARITLESSAQTIEWLADGEYIKTSKGTPTKGSTVVPDQKLAFSETPLLSMFQNSISDLRTVKC